MKSLREQRTEKLLSEFQFFEIEEIAHIITTQIPWGFCIRIINKMRRLTGKGNLGDKIESGGAK